MEARRLAHCESSHSKHLERDIRLTVEHRRVTLMAGSTAMSKLVVVREFFKVSQKL